jgi:DNA-binding response OmpR family regulator
MPKKILIVDDDKQIALLLASRLRANAYEILVAYDAVQAVIKAFREKPDLILLDIKMPAGGGISVLDNLMNSAKTSVIPVIIVTAYPSPEVQKKVMEMGAVGFISKPFKAEEVLSKIREVLGEENREGKG